MVVKRCIFISLVIMSVVTACHRSSNSYPATVEECMDNIVTRLYQTLTPAQLDTIGATWIINNLSEEEKQVLAT